jgi:hypothetical protein
MMHELKIWPHHLSAILSGHKQFEIRLNDRNFEIGDLLMLKEYDPEKSEYTGRWTARKVASMVTRFPGLVEGYVVMGLVPA